jgi:hypothetical protein
MLSDAINDVQNPALCACILWKFVRGYDSASPQGKGSPLPLAFLVLPIILQPTSRGLLQSTQEASGLLAFAGKFRYPPAHLAKRMVDGVEVRAGRDQWFILNERCKDLRSLTLRSLSMGVATGLLQLDPKAGTLKASADTQEPSRIWSPEVREMLRNAEKLGKIFAENSINSVLQALGVSI